MNNNIPKGWIETTLGEIAIINPRETIKKGDMATNVPMACLGNFTKKIQNSERKKFKGGTKFRNGDTLLSRITPCLENGKTSYVDILNDNEVGFGSTEYIVIREKENISDKHFLFYFSISPKFREIAIKLMTGTSGRQRVQTNSLMERKFILPPLQEQKAIAKILTAFDDKIELLQAQNKTLETIAQTIFKEWFGKYQIGDELPEGWRVGIINDFVGELESGKRPKGGVGGIFEGIPSIGAESIGGITNFDYSKTKYVPVGFFKSMTKGIVKEYDILIYKDGGTPGTFIPKFSMFGEGFPFSEFCINEHVFRLQPKKDFQRFYLYNWLNSHYCKKQLQNVGGKAAIPGINSTDLKNLEMIIPDEELIISYNNTVKSLYKKILTNMVQIQSLSKTRDTLLPKLMSGELRVNNFN